MTGERREKAIDKSLRYLASDDALKSLRANAYWPKWDSPWWHMTLLNEMGLAKKIPHRAVQVMVEQLKKSPLTIFPIHPGEMPENLDIARDTHCHCALGNMSQTLFACGVDIDSELPWIRSWFLRYQMPDGGLSCDNDVYLKNPPASSVVGTISPLESVLLCSSRALESDELHFLDLGAQCLLNRELIYASNNSHNADEKEDEADWLMLCFPRFYFYDVLRGLSFVLKWADRLKKKVSRSQISKSLAHLEANFADGNVKIGRLAYENIGTVIHASEGEWTRLPLAPNFELLEEVSLVGVISPELSRQWSETRKLLKSLEQQGLIK